MKHILPINEGWAFVKGCETAPAAIPAGAARVDLPHCWNALDGQDGGSDYWRGPCCYLKTIEKPAGKNVYVEVEAASSVGKIIVNGVEKASHKGGYSLFRANVTDALHDGENLLAIWVDNTQRDDVYPQTADFTFYGGLYRGVNLITVEDSRFDLDYCGGKGFDVSAAVEDGAANWFNVDDYKDVDTIVVREGYFSVKDKIGDIMKNEEAGNVLMQFMQATVKMKLKKSMLGMVKDMTLEGMAGMASSMGIGGKAGADPEQGKRMLITLNEMLNKIKK